MSKENILKDVDFSKVIGVEFKNLREFCNDVGIVYYKGIKIFDDLVKLCEIEKVNRQRFKIIRVLEFENINVWKVYMHVNKLNNKRYVGITSKEVSKRYGKDGKNYKQCIYFYHAINKYGWDNFYHYILYKNLTEQEAKEKERYLIAFYNSNNKNNGYNLTIGGDGTIDTTGRIGELISINESKFPIVQLTLDGILIKEFRNCNKASEELRCRAENIRQCCNNSYGRKTSLGFVWMYKIDYEKHGFDKNNYVYGNCYKKVYQYDKELNLINEYENARIANKETGVGYKLISACCNNNKKTAHGYIWSFTRLDKK